MEELAANEITALHFALNHLWASTGGKGQPYAEWFQSVLATIYGENYAEPVPIEHLPCEVQAWHNEAVQEGLAILQRKEMEEGVILDPADEATLAMMQAQDDLSWTVPLVWQMAEYHRAKTYKRVVARSISQLARIWEALETLEALEETA